VDRPLRLLLLADTHLGLAPEHSDAFERALAPAFRGEVDLVVHGGDVFFRSRIPPSLVLDSFAPLKRLADAGVPVVVVPGNHERSAIPFPLLAAHPSIHIFDRAKTITLDVRGTSIAIAGFPNDRDSIRNTFPALLEATGWREAEAGIRLLCVHQTVEGATVGPSDFFFRGAPDVIAGSDIPTGFAAVLSGHIHRHQVLRRDIRRRPLGSPVFYPGSTHRTSSAERAEPKGTLQFEFVPTPAGGRVHAWRFNELSPALEPFAPRRRMSSVIEHEAAAALRALEGLR
jgi:exonuclease SbcD